MQKRHPSSRWRTSKVNWGRTSTKSCCCHDAYRKNTDKKQKKPSREGVKILRMKRTFLDVPADVFAESQRLFDSIQRIQATRICMQAVTMMTWTRHPMPSVCARHQSMGLHEDQCPTTNSLPRFATIMPKQDNMPSGCSRTTGPRSQPLRRLRPQIGPHFSRRCGLMHFFGSHTFGALSLKSLRTTSNASTHTLFLSLGLEPTSIVGIQFKYCSKVTKTKEWFFCKPQTGFQSWRNSSCSLSIKSVQKSVIHRWYSLKISTAQYDTSNRKLFIEKTSKNDIKRNLNYAISCVHSMLSTINTK